MHYFGAVVVPAGLDDDKIRDIIADAMDPYDENKSSDGLDGWWDWYVLGGRWEGVWGKSDVIPVARLLDDSELMLPHTIVIPDITVLQSEVWDGGNFVPSASDEDKRAALERVRGASIVVVDYHD